MLLLGAHADGSVVRCEGVWPSVALRVVGCVVGREKAAGSGGVGDREVGVVRVWEEGARVGSWPRGEEGRGGGHGLRARAVGRGGGGVLERCGAGLEEREGREGREGGEGVGEMALGRV